MARWADEGVDVVRAAKEVAQSRREDAAGVESEGGDVRQRRGRGAFSARLVVAFVAGSAGLGLAGTGRGPGGGLGVTRGRHDASSADDLPREVSASATDRWSLSSLTFPHRLARLVLVEQLCRAMTILRGEPYGY